MSRAFLRTGVLALIAVASAVTLTRARELSFAERVGAQTGIERVYYAHQLGATRPFEVAVPRAAVERKVRIYLQQSVVLEERWGTPVTAEMLEREVERMVHETRLPERLRELFAALGDDPVLVRECLARQVLVDRLIRSFFASDTRIHDESFGEWWSRMESGVDESRFHPSSLDGADLPHVPDGTPCLPDDTWDHGALDDLPDPRTGHTAVWTGSLVVVWGGSMGAAVNTGARYDPATNTWSPTSTLNAPSARLSHAAVWTGSRMIVWGGAPDPFSSVPGLDTGGLYDPVSDTWTSTSTFHAPSPRAYQAAVWTGSLMIVWGGRAGQTSGPVLNTGGRYDPALDSWTPTATLNAPSARMLHTIVWTGSAMVVWGGTSTNEFNTGGRYDPDSNSWVATSTVNAPSARYTHTAVWTGSAMVVWGGRANNNQFLGTGGRYDPVLDSWTPTSTLGAPLGRSGHAAAWTGNRMVVWGGGQLAAAFDSGGRYDPVADTWASTSMLNAPQARRGHSATWADGSDLMIVWGGAGDFAPYYFSTGGRYDPALDVWTPTSLMDTPTGRKQHTAIWTGSLMIVWGGISSSALRTGARYDPALDAWTPTSLLDAPTARTNHTAVWTGNEMIVWGGNEDESEGSMATGGRYDPVLDEWTPTSMLGAPEARAEHIAVWTGSRMIIWGGIHWFDISNFFLLNTGGGYDPETDTWTSTSTVGIPASGRANAVWTGSKMLALSASTAGFIYDPVADTWAPMSTTNAPTPASNRTAVWTGSAMVVWGGNLTNKGARYDLETDAWTPTSLVGAPSARFRHTAVWTGSQMVVWGGGLSNGTVFDSGGRYDPQTDTWVATSTVNAPSARYSHTAVWTGSRMMIWGGERLGTPYNTGGQYAFGAPTDSDGDGFAGCQGDCNDADPTVHPGAAELCDGLDNDCNGLVGDIDEDGDGSCRPDDCNDLDPLTQLVALEVQGVVIEKRQPTRIHFTTQDGIAGSATSYDVAAGPVELSETQGFESAWCVGTFADTPAEDAGPDPAPGYGYYYLVRAKNSCGTGGWGEQSDGSERVVTACP